MFSLHRTSEEKTGVANKGTRHISAYNALLCENIFIVKHVHEIIEKRHYMYSLIATCLRKGNFPPYCHITFIDVNGANSKQSKISRSVINFQRKILSFKELQVPLKRHFEFQHFSRSSRTFMNPDYRIDRCLPKTASISSVRPHA